MKKLTLSLLLSSCVLTAGAQTLTPSPITHAFWVTPSLLSFSLSPAIEKEAATFIKQGSDKRLVIINQSGKVLTDYLAGTIHQLAVHQGVSNKLTVALENKRTHNVTPVFAPEDTNTLHTHANITTTPPTVTDIKLTTTCAENSQTQCPLYLNGNQQMEMTVLFNASTSNPPQAPFQPDLNKVQFIDTQNGDVIPVGQTTDGILITQTSNGYPNIQDPNNVPTTAQAVAALSTKHHNRSLLALPKAGYSANQFYVSIQSPLQGGQAVTLEAKFGSDQSNPDLTILAYTPPDYTSIGYCVNISQSSPSNSSQKGFYPGLTYDMGQVNPTDQSGHPMNTSSASLELTNPPQSPVKGCTLPMRAPTNLQAWSTCNYEYENLYTYQTIYFKYQTQLQQNPKGVLFYELHPNPDNSNQFNSSMTFNVKGIDEYGNAYPSTGAVIFQVIKGVLQTTCSNT